MALIGRMAKLDTKKEAVVKKAVAAVLPSNKTAANTGVGRMAGLITEKKNTDILPQKTGAGNAIWRFVKNAPTMLARTVAQPVEFVEKTGSTVGKGLASLDKQNKVGKFLVKKFGITKEGAQAFKSGMEQDITLPGQTEALIKKPTAFTSGREFAGSALEAGLNIGTAFMGGVGAGQVAKEGIKLSGKLLAKQILIDAAIGSGFGVTTSMQDKNATGMDILKSGAIGAGVGALLPQVGGGVLKVLGKGAKVLGGAINKGIDKTALKLEQKAIPVVEQIGKRFYENADKPIQTKVQQLAEKTAGVLRGVQQLPQKIKSSFLDKYAPIENFQNKAKAAGIDTPDLLERTQAAKYRAAGKAENRLDDYLGLRAKNGEDWNIVKEYSHYLDDLDRLTNGNTISGNRTAEQVGADLSKLQQTLSPEQLVKVKQGQQELQGFLNQELRDAVDSGRLSEAQYGSIKAAHPNYIPHNVLDFLDEGAGKGVGNSFNMAKSGIEKAKGSARAIDDMDNAIVDRLYKNQLLNEKNKTVNAIIDTGRKMGEKSGFIPLKEGIKEVDIPKGFEKISRFQNGAKEEWLIPDDIGKSLKNMNSEEGSAVMSWLNNSIPGKILTAPANAIRKLATGVNPVFAMFSNPARDIQTVQITAKANPVDYAIGLIKSITAGKGDDELYRLARESGALQGSIFRENMKPNEILNQKISQRLGNKQNKIADVLGKISRPDKLVEEAGQKFEEMSRIAVFRRALLDGSTPEQAAKLTRNATVDFGKSGNWIQIANKVIPFLNARIQGFANLGKAIAKDPTRVIRKGMWTAAYPATLLYAHNQNYESYQNIPDYEKRKYWVFMVGETEGKDYDGKKILTPLYIKIPKGEAQQAISNTMERVLNAGKEKYPDTTLEFLHKLIGDISPVTESSVWPAGLQQYGELKTNYSLFKQAPIEGDWTMIGKKWYKTSEIQPKYRTTSGTSEMAKALGNALNWSPVKIDYVLKTGVINDLLRIWDIPAKGFKNKEGGSFEKAAELPALRSILGTSNFGQQQAEKKQKQKELMEKNNLKIEKSSNQKTPVKGAFVGVGRMAK